MQKKLITAAAILLLLLFSLIGFLQYRQYSSYKIPIHANAQTIIRVNADAFIKSLIKEYGLNFSNKIKRKKREEKDGSKNTGIYFPGNLFIYNISSILPTTFFCTVPVYDLKDFKHYVKTKFNILLTDSVSFSTGTSADGKITIACNKEYISIAYSFKKEEVLSSLKEVLSSKNILSQNDKMAAALKKENQHIVVVNGQSISTFNFKDNQLLVHASIDTFHKFNTLFFMKKRVADKESHAFFSLSAFPTAALFKKQYTIKQYTIETDSILSYFNGYADVELGPSVSQADTLITYEYDDNFEKVEKQTIVNVKVPSINISLMADPGLLQYLQHQQIVTNEMKLNKEIFPLYNVAVRQSDLILHFTTNPGNKIAPDSFVNAGHFLDLKMDVKKTVDALNIAYLQAYTKNISAIGITASKKSGIIILDGTLSFEGSSLKGIIDMIKSF